MGQIITQFVHERRNLPEISFFTDKSLSKVQQFYQHYKYCSDTFAIDDTVFKDIFGQLHPVFQILDTNSSLLIDGLELFSALSLFSKLIKLQDKIQFIFKIFDFNALRSLSITDTEFMVLTCCSVTHKLLGIKSSLRDDIIMSFVHEQFQAYNRVNISQFKKWGITSNIVTKFINLIYNEQQEIFRNNEQQEQKPINSLLSQKIYRSYVTCSRNQLGSLFGQNSRLAASKQILQKQRRIWFTSNKNLIDYDNAGQTTTTTNQNKITINKKPTKIPSDSSDFTLVPNWIYGIRYKDVKYFINYVDQNQIIYFVGKIVILYNLQSHKQRHYLYHDKPVICVAVTQSTQTNSNCNCNVMVASSQIVTVDNINQQTPAIRIWNPVNLHTIALIRGQHKIGVHLMSFTNSTQYLVTCGLIFYSPIVVYSVRQNFKPIYSVCCLHPTVQISTLYGIIDKKSQDFIIATLYGVKYFEVVQKNSQISINYTDMNNCIRDNTQQNTDGYQYGNFSPITSCAFIHTNYFEKYLSSYDNNLQKLIITGHEKGEVFVWSTAQKTILYELNVQPCEIVNIIPSTSHILICSNSSVISFWDIDLNKNKKLFQIDITTLDMQLQGHQVCGIVHKPLYQCDGGQLTNDFASFQYIVATTKGDFFIFNLQQKQDHSLRYKLIGPRFQSKKIDKILSIDWICTQKLLQRQDQQNLLIYGGVSGNLYIVSTVSHQVIQIWKIGEPIIAVDAIQIKQNLQIVVATSYKRVYTSTNFVQKNQKYQCEKNIKCIKLIIDNNSLLMILGLDGGYLHFVDTELNIAKKKNSRNLAPTQSRKMVPTHPKIDQVNQNANRILASNYAISNVNTISTNSNNGKQNVLKKIKLASTPTQIVNLQKKMLLVSTEDNIFYTISMKDFHFKAIQPHINPLSSNMIKNRCIKSYYCLSQLGKGLNKSKKIYKLPVLMGKTEKLVIGANFDSSINLWKDLSQSAQLNKLQYDWHASRCINFSIDQQLTHFYSSGYKDGMIVQSLLLRFYQSTRTVLDPLRALISAESIQSLSHYQQNGQYGNQIDTLIQRQIQFCTFNNEITTKRYDQHIQIRGIENQTLCRMFEGMSQQWKLINKLAITKSAPKISLKLDYVYGVQTDNKRSTVLAINFPNTYFVYFISNLVIVYDPRSNGQKIYKGHRFKITCIDKIFMPQEYGDNLVQVIVSGQSSFRPIIKIWHPHTLQTIKTIQTVHTEGIINIFCTNKVILSFGISNKRNKQRQREKGKQKQRQKQKQKERLFSLQLSEISSGSSIASRHIKQYILSMAISPLNPNYFVTTGHYNVTVWVLTSGNIEKYSVIQTNSTVTCCLYRLVEQTIPSYDKFDVKLKDDATYTEQIIIGSQNGQLGIICNLSKYLIIEQKAHQKAINCITYINQISPSRNQKQVNKYRKETYYYKNKNIKHIVTCSEDQTLKIWSKKFEIQFEQEIRKTELQEKNFFNSNSIPNNPNNRKGNNSSCKNKSLYKNVSIQSLSPIYDINKPNNMLSLLIATRNGDVFVLEESNSLVNNNIVSKNAFIHKAQSEVKSSFGNKKGEDQTDQIVSRNQHTRLPSKRSSKVIKQNQKIRSNRKSINAGNKLKMLRQMSNSNMGSNFYKQKSIDISYQNEKDAQQNNLKSLQSIKFVLYLRSHSSQICTSTRAQFISNKQKGGKVLFSHHPKLQLVATLAEDQNLFFWDTQRNLSIFHIILGYMAQPTVLKFTKDGDILIVGYSDGYVMFLDSQISKSHQGKGDQKFILPSLVHVMQIRNDCPVLAIQQSQSGDYLAISFNNKKCTVTDKAYKKQTRKSSHILIYLNKSRERTRNHANNKMQSNNMFEMVTKIPCQTDSVYNTSNNNEYGVAAHAMMFTESQGKTYLLIYEQLINMNTHKTLDLDKDGNYVIWDVNTSTMIANTDQISNLIWKRICIPNSIYARYLLYPNLTKNQQFNNVENINSNANLYTPSFTAMLNLPSHIFLGSLNGDIHIAQTSCLQYDKMLIANPRQKELFVGKTYPAHCSQVNHIQFNQEKSLLFTSGLTDRCILKWRIQGQFNIQLINSESSHQKNIEPLNGANGQKLNSIYLKINQAKDQKEQKQEQTQKIDDQFDIFKQVPHFKQIQQMKTLYRFKQKFSWASIPNNFNSNIQIEELQKFKQNNFVRNLCNFIQTIRVTNIIGRNAHNNRNNLWYDQKSRIVYNTGHAIVVFTSKNIYKIKKQLIKMSKQTDNLKRLTNENSPMSSTLSCQDKQFIHIINGRGQQLCQEINCTCISEDRKLIYAGHNGTSGSVSVWNVSTKLRLKTIILKQIMIILKIRVSHDNKTLIVYGINEQKNAYLMLICLSSCSVVGIVSFLHEKVCHVKDIAFYPKSNCRFVTCGVNDTLSWKLQGDQLTYSILPCVIQNSNNLTQNYNNGLNYAHKSINICITFLPKSSRVITGCQDGNLLLWGENSFQRREHADVVMVLKTAHPNILLSGSRDGSILLWMQQTNGGGLTLCSKLNLRNQSEGIMKAYGINLYKKNTMQSQSLQSEMDQNMDEMRIKKRKMQKTILQTSKQIDHNSKYQNTNNTLKQAFLQELAVQSIEIFDVKAENQLQGEQNRRQGSITPEHSTDINFKQNANKINQGQSIKIKNELQVYHNQLQHLRQNFDPRRWKVLIGTTSGNIYESTFSQQSKSKLIFDKNCQLLEVYHDHEVPKSFFFSKTDQEIYQINSKGYLCCRRVADSTIIFQQNFDRQTIDMIYSPKNNIFFIIFKTEIVSYSTFQMPNQLQSSQWVLKPLATRQIKFITHAQISSHQKVLAVGVTKNSDKTVNIQVYDISRKDEIKFLLSFAIPPGQSIQFIDFSSNNKVVLVKLASADKIKIITQQLITLQSIKQDHISFTQWNNRAQNLYDRNRKIIQKVQQVITNKNQNATSSQSKGELNQLSIIRISEISDNVFILIDNQGNVYGFNSEIKLIGESRIKISQPSIIKFSHSKKLLGIGSQTDRNIVIFDIGLTHYLKGLS